MRTGKALSAFVTLGAVLLSLAPPALGHPDDDMNRLRLVVASWANAAISRDAEAMRAEVALRRWVNMAAEGWYSGDTHVHFLSPATAALEGRGEEGKPAAEEKS